MATDDITLSRVDDVERDGQTFAVYVSSDGEILELPLAGAGALSYAVAQFEEAKAQEKGWQAVKARWASLIIAEQGEKKASYGDVVVSIRQNPIMEFDRDKFGAAFINRFPVVGLEMGRAAELVGVLGAVTGLDEAALKEAELPEWVPLAKRVPTGRYTRPWVDTRHVLRDFRS